MLSHYKFRISISDKYRFRARISILCRLLLFIAVKCFFQPFPQLSMTVSGSMYTFPFFLKRVSE